MAFYFVLSEKTGEDVGCAFEEDFEARVTIAGFAFWSILQTDGAGCAPNISAGLEISQPPGQIWVENFEPLSFAAMQSASFIAAEANGWGASISVGADIRSFGGHSCGGAFVSGSVIKTGAGGAANLGSGAVVYRFGKRVSLTALTSGAGIHLSTFVKRLVGGGSSAGGGSTFTMFSKVTGAITFTALSAGAGTVAGNVVKRGAGVGQASGGGSNNASGSRRSTFAGIGTGTGLATASGAKRGSGGLLIAGGGLSVSLSIRRATAAAGIGGGGQVRAAVAKMAIVKGFDFGGGSQAGGLLKRSVSNGIIGGGGSAFTLFNKVVGAISFTAILAGAGSLAAAGGKRVSSAGRNQGGGGNHANAAKRATVGAQAVSGGLGRATVAKRAIVLSSMLSGGVTASQSIRRATATTGIAGAGGSKADFAKRVTASATIGGGGFIIALGGLPPLSDIAVIAGVWLQRLVIDGVVSGAVTIAGVNAQFANISADSKVIALDGIIETSIEIEGRRTIT